jgi:DNA-binding NtrC family response regulator
MSRHARESQENEKQPGGVVFGADRAVPGTSPQARRLRERIRALAQTQVPVLVSGPEGAGCRSIAAAIHHENRHDRGSLVAIAAHEFAGDRIPFAARAVLLCDVEDLTPKGQQFFRVRLSDDAGGTEPRLRLFATTRAPELLESKTPHFDELLRRALMRFHLRIPPLHERPEDIPAIARELARRMATVLGRGEVQFSDEALALLRTRRFDRNLVELEELVARAIGFCTERVISRELVLQLCIESSESLQMLRARREDREREQLRRFLRETGGNITHTAASMKRSRGSIYRLIEKYNLFSERGHAAQ